jgi:hypothetical protein
MDKSNKEEGKLSLHLPIYQIEVKMKEIRERPERPQATPISTWTEKNIILKILSSQKRGGYRGVSIDSFRLPSPSLMFFFNT